MACSLSQQIQILWVRSPHTNSSSKSQALIRRSRNFSCRLRTLKSSSPRNSSTSPQSSSEKSNSKPPLAPNREDIPCSNSPSGFSLFDSFSIRLPRLSDGILKFDELVPEILSIALPAALALAADPLASLVDTAFVGHIGSAELAAVGVSVSVFNLISKLFNVPLLNITTSFVAEEQASLDKRDDNFSQLNEDFQGRRKSKKYLPSVSTSLALAASIGIAEAVALYLGSGTLMDIMGLPADSPMRVPAEHFLTWRGFGAPPIVIALAAQGTFRGFKDTKTPLYAVGKYCCISLSLSLVVVNSN
ncbi:hypothetical protein FEM48_Zijuj11G0117500 [Ziziphus jujuba var. spinosa]|uniref:Uncharacterized protein n=1 Tax=Ziziphus jujuba var. spinosa TaxID=714518 RepID=A0A978UIR4_ZIZJJ|nr:hypothetical protein FEM48_Zijuj11G0117500 [Ziziphus jujuba var. spinosa]